MTDARTLWNTVDDLLRGRFTESADLRAGRVPVPVRTTVTVSLLLGAIYGMFMGLFGALRAQNTAWVQVFANAAKVPLLFLLTLLVTVPSLYVVSALARSRLRFTQTLRLLLVAITVHLALLASFGPVTGFFTLSTESYPFMVLLNVLFFGIGGVAGLVLLRRTVDTIFEDDTPSPAPAPAPQGDTPATAQPHVAVRRPASHRIFVAWMVIYGVVGAQMGWILRPFVGAPGRPFTLFRERDSSFFEAVIRALHDLFS